MTTCPQCGRDAVNDSVCMFCGWREPEHRLTGQEFMTMERDNKREQATDALTEAVCKASLQARAQKRKARIIVATAAKLVPSREVVADVGEETAKNMLAQRVKADIARNGTIVIGIVGSILLFPIFMNILIGVICALIVRWIVNDREKYGLIQQARG